mgnify:CR=1 FL=1
MNCHAGNIHRRSISAHPALQPYRKIAYWNGSGIPSSFIGCLQAVRRDDCHILCGNNSSICMHNTILGLCKGTDRQHKKQTCENKFIYSPHSLIQPGYWKSQLRQPSLIRTYVLFCFLMIQSCSSSSRFRDSTIDFKA